MDISQTTASRAARTLGRISPFDTCYLRKKRPTLEQRYAMRTYRRFRIQAKRRLDKIYLRLGVPDSSWRWCGIRKCNKKACVWVDPSNKLTLCHRMPDIDIEAVNRRIEISMRNLSQDLNDISIRSLTEFATSPAVKIMAAEYIHDFMALKLPETYFDSYLDYATDAFIWLKTNPEHEATAGYLHDALVPTESEKKRWTLKDLLLRFMIRAEGWRDRQVEFGREWNWNPSQSPSVCKAVITCYHQMLEFKYLVFKKVPAAFWTDVWVFWIDEYIMAKEVAFLPTDEVSVETDDDKEDRYSFYHLWQELWHTPDPKDADQVDPEPEPEPESEVFDGLGEDENSWWIPPVRSTDENLPCH